MSQDDFDQDEFDRQTRWYYGIQSEEDYPKYTDSERQEHCREKTRELFGCIGMLGTIFGVFFLAVLSLYVFIQSKFLLDAMWCMGICAGFIILMLLGGYCCRRTWSYIKSLF